jgi:hypothetical protein
MQIYANINMQKLIVISNRSVCHLLYICKYFLIKCDLAMCYINRVSNFSQNIDQFKIVNGIFQTSTTIVLAQ